MHLEMLSWASRFRRVTRSLRGVKDAFLARAPLYGLDWGDPDVVEPLRFIRDRYVLPYARTAQAAVEIGPGGGRWTRYLLDVETLYLVDVHQELLDELTRHLEIRKARLVRNSGTDFPGIPDASIDFLFSFGTFVHLDAPTIERYLANMRRVLKPGANAVVQYADQTKVMAQLNEGFSDTTPDRMRQMVTAAGYRIVEEDLTTLWHSSVIRFTP